MKCCLCGNSNCECQTICKDLQAEVERLKAHITEASFWLEKALDSRGFIAPEEFDRRIALANRELNSAMGGDVEP